MRRLIVGLAMALASVPATAVAQSDLKIINDPASLDWFYYGTGYKLTPLPTAPIPGGAAVEVAVERGVQPYTAGTTIKLKGPFVKGRDYVISFWARALSSNASDKQGRILVRFFRDSDPYPGFGDKTVSIGPDWKRYEVTARANMDIRDDAAVGLQLASVKQTLQIGQAYVVEGATTIAENAPASSAKDPLPPQLVGKGDLLNDPENRNWVAYGNAQSVTATTTDVFTRKATLHDVRSAGTKPYDAGLNVPIAQAVAKGDRLLVAVLARTRSADTADGKAVVSLRMQKNQPPYDGWGEAAIQLTSGWKLIQWQTEAQMDLPANSGEVAIHTGLAKQQVEVGPVYVIRLK